MSPKKKETTQNTGPSRSTSKGQRLPILWETVNTLSRIIVTLLGVAVAVISYLSGSGYLMSAIRAGAAMLGVGFILWLVYWMIVKGSIDMMSSLLKEQKDQNYQNGSMEFKA
jgi:hypothetical protein